MLEESSPHHSLLGFFRCYPFHNLKELYFLHTRAIPTSNCSLVQPFFIAFRHCFFLHTRVRLMAGAKVIFLLKGFL